MTRGKQRNLIFRIKEFREATGAGPKEAKEWCEANPDGTLLPATNIQRAHTIEVIAEAWASIDGKLEKFIGCKADPVREEIQGHYSGYLVDAEELIKRAEECGVCFSFGRSHDLPR